MTRVDGPDDRAEAAPGQTALGDDIGDAALCRASGQQVRNDPIRFWIGLHPEHVQKLGIADLGGMQVPFGDQHHLIGKLARQGGADASERLAKADPLDPRLGFDRNRAYGPIAELGEIIEGVMGGPTARIRVGHLRRLIPQVPDIGTRQK